MRVDEYRYKEVMDVGKKIGNWIGSKVCRYG